jgi:hypothetical protein
MPSGALGSFGWRGRLFPICAPSQPMSRRVVSDLLRSIIGQYDDEADKVECRQAADDAQ